MIDLPPWWSRIWISVVVLAKTTEQDARRGVQWRQNHLGERFRGRARSPQPTPLDTLCKLGEDDHLLEVTLVSFRNTYVLA
jgi:hypothetical protein